MGNPILCDLILIRSALSPRAARVGVQEIEKAIAGLVEAGLSPEEAFDTYSAVSVHVRGSVVLHRLQEKNQATENGGRTIEDAMVIDPETTPLLAQMTAGASHRCRRRQQLRVRPRLHPRPCHPTDRAELEVDWPAT